MTVRIDLQTHTSHSSDCGWMAPETLVHRASVNGLDGVAVTDHNTMAGVEPAREAASEDFLVIPAIEVDTHEGQIIGLFVTEPIDPWQSPATVIEEIHQQAGLAVAPHPFDTLREGLQTIDEHVDQLDAIETLNSRCLRSVYNKRAQAFAESHQLTATGGSDAHFAREVGTAYTRVETDQHDGTDTDRTLEAVKRALAEGQVEPAGHRGPFYVHAGTKGVKLYNRLRNR